MTTPSRTEQLLGPLLERTDLALVGDRLLLKPVRNVAQFIWIEEFPRSATFQTIWSVQLLCCPFDLLELSGEVWTGSHSSDPAGRTTFFELPPEQQSAILCRKIDEEVLRELAELGSPDKVAQRFLTAEGPNTDDSRLRFFFELVRGRFDMARSLLAQHRATWADEAEYPLFDDREWNDRLETVCRLLELGREAQVAPLLHQWEEIAAKNFGIERYHEPTPFPFEAAGPAL